MAEPGLMFLETGNLFLPANVRLNTHKNAQSRDLIILAGAFRAGL